jgi:hypothetical protein
LGGTSQCETGAPEELPPSTPVLDAPVELDDDVEVPVASVETDAGSGPPELLVGSVPGAGSVPPASEPDSTRETQAATSTTTQRNPRPTSMRMSRRAALFFTPPEFRVCGDLTAITPA